MYLEEIRHLSNQRLSTECARQNARFMQEKSASDGRYCRELIRRVVFQIDDADRFFYEIYGPWLQRKIGALCRQTPEIVADLTQDALLRFFRYITPDTWTKFSNLAQLLAYLAKCGETSVLTYHRQASRQASLMLDLPAEVHIEETAVSTPRPIEQSVSQKNLRQQVWQCIKRNCKDSSDYLLAKQMWLYGMKPRELVKTFTDTFPKLTDIYKRKRNLIDRIKRDANCEALSALI